MNRIVILQIVLCMVTSCCWGAEAEWRYVSVVNGEIYGSSVRNYYISGCVYAGNRGLGSAEGPLVGYSNSEGFHLLQQDHKTTAMSVDNNVWVLASLGDMLNAEAIESLQKVELCDWNISEPVGGIIVDTPADFYLGFMSTGDNAWDGIDRYGWFRVGIDQNLDMYIIDSRVGLYGEAVYVGGGAVPEPDSGFLLLVGLLVLTLRRPIENRTLC